MKHFLALTAIFLGALILFSPPPSAELGALEKGPQPHPVLQRESALAQVSFSNILKSALPGRLSLNGAKVLLTGREQDAEREKFSDHENINEAANALNRVQPAFSTREENGRMQAVDFLVQSLTQGDTDYAIGAIAEVMLSDKLYQTKDLDYRKSLVGDRVELYQALAATHPEVAQGIFQRAQGTSLAAVLRFAKGRADFNAKLAMGR